MTELTPKMLREALKAVSVRTLEKIHGYGVIHQLMLKHKIATPRRPGQCINRVDNLGVQGRRKGYEKGIGARP